jgi:hypothetical protein
MARVAFDVPGLDPSLPEFKIDELHISKSKIANGYDCEFTLLDTVVSNIRINEITIGNLILAAQEAAKTAWALRKTDAHVTDFNMTVNRGGNKPN